MAEVMPALQDDNGDELKLDLDAYGQILAEAILEDRRDFLVKGGSNELASDDNDCSALSIMSEAGKVRCRILYHMKSTPKNTKKLIELFKKAPAYIHGHLRLNIIKLAKDPDLTDKQRNVYIKSFTDAYLKLTLELDHAAFPPHGVKPENGLPSYLPDMFTDLGSDKRTEGRSWEKYCLSKRDLFEIHGELIRDILKTDESKEETVKRLAEAVRGGRTYARFNSRTGKGKLPRHIEDFYQITVTARARHQVGVGVCRHDALDFQGLAQMVGIESRVVPCLLDGGPHYVNIVRLNNVWYLLDCTNPGIGGVYLRDLKDANFVPENLKNRPYTWRFGTIIKHRTYITSDKASYSEIKHPNYQDPYHDLDPEDARILREHALEHEEEAREIDRRKARINKRGEKWLNSRRDGVFDDTDDRTNPDDYDPFD